MRVVFFTHTFVPDYIAGAEISLYHTCRGLQARGYDCLVLTVNSRGRERADQWYEVDGIPVHRLTWVTKKRHALTDLFDARVFSPVQRDLHRLQPDIFHLHNVAQATLAPFVAAQTTRTPTVCTLHDHWLLCPANMLYRADGTLCDPAQHPDGRCGNCYRRYEYWADLPQRRQWMQRLTSNVRRFISPSQALIELHVAGGFERQRFRHLPNALPEPDLLEAHHEQVVEACRAARTRPTLVFAGGGVHNKGADVILRAIPGLLAAIPDLQFVIAGPGEPEYFQQYARYAPAVRVLGKVPFSEMRALFAAADLALIASVWPENSPMTIYENFQVGTPMLASAVGGIPEMIDEGKTGYLFPPNDHETLVAQALRHFQRPPHERRQMRQACITTARTRWAIEHHLDLTEAVYAEVHAELQRVGKGNAADNGGAGLMRVLHVSHQYAPAIGGSERYITDLSEELVRRGHEVDVFTSRALDYQSWKSVLPKRETLNGVNIQRFAAWPRRGHSWRALELGLGNYWPKRSLIYEPFIFYGNGPIMPGLFAAVLAQAGRYDLMHINQLHYAHAAVAYSAAKARGLPVVITPHLHAEQRETYDVGYLQDILRGSEVILTVTGAEHDFLLRQGFPPMQTVIGGNSLNLAHFPPQESAAARARLGIPSDAFVVLFLGRKTRYKGLEPSLRAFIELRASHPNAYFVAMGPETEASLKLWRQLGKLPNLLVRDRVEDDERLAALAAADVLLMPSSGEAFGIVYLEAWAYRKPVIGAPIQAVKALISDGVDGWLIEPEAVEEIRLRLAWLADHPAAARAAGEAGHEKLLRRYTTTRITDVVEGAYLRPTPPPEPPTSD